MCDLGDDERENLAKDLNDAIVDAANSNMNARAQRVVKTLMRAVALLAGLDSDGHGFWVEPKE